MQLERGEVVLFCFLTRLEQSVATFGQRLDTWRASPLGPVRESRQRLGRPLWLAKPDRGLNQVRDAPQGGCVIASRPMPDGLQLDQCRVGVAAAQVEQSKRPVHPGLGPRGESADRLGKSG